MPVKGGGSASGPQRRPKPKPRPKAKPATVFDRLGQQSGPASKASGVPARAKAREPARNRPPATRDSPANRGKDLAKADRYNRSPEGKQSRKVARKAEDDRQTRQALSGIRTALQGHRLERQRPGLPARAAATANRELSGEGVIVPSLSAAARAVAKFSTSNPYGSDVERSGIGIHGELRKGPRKLAENTLDLPASAITGTYVYGRAAAKAATGDTSEAKKVVEGIKKDDPVYAAATGDFKRALKLAKENPGFAAAEVFGVGHALNRGAGRTVRGTGRVVKGVGKATGSKKTQQTGEKIRRVAATETRPDAVVPGTNLRVSRKYDRGLVSKGVQVRRDRKRTAEADNKRQRAANLDRDPNGNAETATQLRREAAERDPRIATPGQIKRSVDIYEAASESNRKRKMVDADNAFERVVGTAPVRRVARNTVSRVRRRPSTATKRIDTGASINLISQGIARADVGDLRAYRGELERVYPNLDTPSKRKANEQARRLIDESLAREKRKPGSLKQSAERARQYSREVDEPLDKILGDFGLIDRDRAAKVKVQAYAARRLGAKYDDKGKRWVNQEGDPLDYPAVAKQMASEPDAVQPSYVSQAPNATSAGSYYRSSYQMPTYAGKRGRTEKPTKQGTFDASPEALRARGTKAANVIAAAENYRGFVKEYGVRDKDGKPEITDRKTADGIAEQLTDKTGVPFRVIRTAPWSVDRQQFAAMLDAIGDEADARSFEPFRKQLDTGLSGEGEGPFAVIPETAARQLQEHMSVLNPSDAGKLAQAARASFSRTVLSLSPSPTVGNAIEGGFRAAVGRAGPTSRITYGRVMKRLREIDPDAADRFEDRTLGTGRVSLQTQRRYTEPGQFADGPMRKLVAATGSIRKLPAGKQLSGAWNAWTTFVFDTVNNKLIERPLQKAMVGKQIRDSGLMNDGMSNLSKTAIDQAAQGLRGTAEQIAMADGLRDMYGAYRSFGPAKRKLVANYTPFIAWYLNSVRFMTQVLPRDHPTLLAVMASAAQVTDDVDQQKANPAWLKGTLNAGGVKWQATRNTPFGAATDPLGTASGLILPQLSPLIDAGQGEDFTGKKLRNKDGSPYTQAQLIEHAVAEMAKSSIPLVAVPDRVNKYANNPGSLLNAVRVNSKGKQKNSQGPRVKAAKRKQQGGDVLKRQMDALDRVQQQDANKVLEQQMKALEQAGVK